MAQLGVDRGHWTTLCHGNPPGSRARGKVHSERPELGSCPAGSHPGVCSSSAPASRQHSWVPEHRMEVFLPGPHKGPSWFPQAHMVGPGSTSHRALWEQWEARSTLVRPHSRSVRCGSHRAANAPRSLPQPRDGRGERGADSSTHSARFNHSLPVTMGSALGGAQGAGGGDGGWCWSPAVLSCSLGPDRVDAETIQAGQFHSGSPLSHRGLPQGRNVRV